MSTFYTQIITCAVRCNPKFGFPDAEIPTQNGCGTAPKFAMRPTCKAGISCVASTKCHARGYTRIAMTCVQLMRKCREESRRNWTNCRCMTSSLKLRQYAVADCTLRLALCACELFLHCSRPGGGGDGRGMGRGTIAMGGACRSIAMSAARS